MGIFDGLRKRIYGRKKEPIPEIIEPEEPEIPKPVEDIKPMIKSMAKRLREHDKYVRKNIAKEMTLKELIQAIEKRFQAIPITKSAKKKLSDNQKKILAILKEKYPDYLTYSEIAAMTFLTANGVRGMISEMSKLGIKFDKKGLGKKTIVQLIPIAPSDKAIPESDSNDSNQLKKKE